MGQKIFNNTELPLLHACLNIIESELSKETELRTFSKKKNRASNRGIAYKIQINAYMQQGNVFKLFKFGAKKNLICTSNG